MTKQQFTTQVEVDPKTNETYIEIPKTIIEDLSDGDTIEWIDNQDGTWTIIISEN